MKKKSKALIITFICLIVFCVLLIVGASFVHQFVPQLKQIYTVMYVLGGLGTYVFGIALLIYCVCDDEEEKTHYSKW